MRSTASSLVSVLCVERANLGLWSARRRISTAAAVAAAVATAAVIPEATGAATASVADAAVAAAASGLSILASRLRAVFDLEVLLLTVGAETHCVDVAGNVVFIEDGSEIRIWISRRSY